MRNKPVPQLAKYDPKKGRQMKGYLLIAIPAVIGLFIVKDIVTTVFTPQPTAATNQIEESIDSEQSEEPAKEKPQYQTQAMVNQYITMYDQSPDLSTNAKFLGCFQTIVALNQAESEGDAVYSARYTAIAKYDNCFDVTQFDIK